MKKNTLLLFSLFSLWGVSVSAQTGEIRKKIISTYDKVNVEELEALEKERIQEKEFAYKMAKENNKPISGVMKDGRVFSLQRINENGTYIYYATSNAGSRRTARVDDVAPGGSLGLNLDGTGMLVGVWDGQPALDTHVEFQAAAGGSRMTLRKPLLNLGTASNDEKIAFERGRSHATHVSGTIAAKGTNASARGMAPAARIISYDWDRDTEYMRRAAQQDALLVSNHSYGYPAVDDNGNAMLAVLDFGTYDRKSVDFDKVIFQFKYYQPVVAAGNDRDDYRIINPGKGGNDLLTGTAVSKNAIVVAAVEQVASYTGPNSVRMSVFSNFGPTNDFRIKPDISAKGVSVLSSNYQLPTPINGAPRNNLYSNSSGTSMAAPAVTGVIALWQQWAMEKNNEAFKSATIRALMVHTADEAGDAPGPDHKFGWGLINAKGGVQVLEGSKVSGVVLEENVLAQGATFEKQFSVGEGGINIIVTMAWTDPEGVYVANNSNETYAKNNPSLVNDLDLRVFKDGVEYFPWRLNKDFNNLVAQKGDNNVDNVEKIEIEGAEAGIYTVKVTHKGTLNGGNQEFSIIMSRNDFNNLSTEEFELNDLSFSIWPNPVVDQLNVTIPEEIQVQGMSIQVFDMTGRLVKNVPTLTSNQVELDMKGLSSGTYFVKIKGNGVDKTERIVKK
ncbi:S8 family serine peptidase [Myroides fluvii]|uniref:S8 family serine peptidase n=1 Tax=Myroides fluvii TaxID=2572594 RepID=UPI00131B5CA0|nr:S8 family serine peptidase [Myroides fluvii]